MMESFKKAVRDIWSTPSTIVALLALALVLGGRCVDNSAPIAPVLPRGFGSFGAINAGGAPSTSFSGVIDPTNAAWGPGGMIACNSGCSAPTAEQNRKALKAVIDYASSQGRTVYIPPGQYPIGCASGQPFGVDTSGDSNVTIEGWNVTLRFTGDQASADCAMLRIRNGSHVVLRGLTFSGRDITNSTSSSLPVKVGDGGATSVDDVKFEDVAFIEGVGGDFLRLDGGTGTATVTNVVVTQGSRFEGSARAGVDVRAGTSRVTISYSFFRSNANRDVWFESSGSGAIGQSIVSGNFMERDGSGTALAVTLSGGATDAADQSIFEHNHIKPIPGASTGGGGVEAGNVTNLIIQNNPIILNFSTSTPVLRIVGKATNVQVVNNYLERGSTAGANKVLVVEDDGSIAPVMTLIKRNRIIDSGGATYGIDLGSCVRCRVDRNSISYFHATAATFVGVRCHGETNACSGSWTQNWVQKESGAGSIAAAYKWTKGAAGTVGALTVRDNWSDGAVDVMNSDANSSSDYPEGYPVISGNQYANATNELNGGIATWRTETTSDAETVASGALSISKHTTFVTTNNTVTYSLADGVVDGFVKCGKIKTVTGTPVATLTPAHMADGTTHTITWTAAGGYFCLAWDKTSATYRVVGSSGVTVN